MRSRAALLIWAVSARLVIAGPQEPGEDVLAAGPRPVSEAVRLFQERCHCVVTYEDPKWRADQVDEFFGTRRAGAEKTLIPAGHPFMFIVPRDVAVRPRAEIGVSLQEMLDSYDRTSDAGLFRLVAADTAWHIVPRVGSALDARITVPLANRSIDEAIAAILAAVRTSTGEDIAFAGTASNWRKQTRATIGADSERARDVLARVLTTDHTEYSWDARSHVLTANPAKCSWALLYDFSVRRFYLNLRSVKRPGTA